MTAIFSQATSLVSFYSYFPCFAVSKDFRSSRIPETELPLFRERPSSIEYARKKFAKAGKSAIFGTIRSDLGLTLEKTMESNHLQAALSTQLFKEPECWPGQGLEPKTSRTVVRY